MPTVGELSLKPGDIAFIANLGIRDVPGLRWYTKPDMTSGTKVRVIGVVPNWHTLVEKLAPPDHVQHGTLDTLSDMNVGTQFLIDGKYSAFFRESEEYRG